MHNEQQPLHLREAFSVAAEVLSQLTAGLPTEDILTNIDLSDAWLSQLAQGLEQLASHRVAVVLDDKKTWFGLENTALVEWSDTLVSDIENGIAPRIIGYV